MFRKYRRRKISAESYEIIRAQFNDMMLNYQLAMKLYRQPSWYSETPSRFAEEDE